MTAEIFILKGIFARPCVVRKSFGLEVTSLDRLKEDIVDFQHAQFDRRKETLWHYGQKSGKSGTLKKIKVMEFSQM